MSEPHAPRPEMHDAIEALADCIGKALSELNISAALGASALITVLMAFFESEIADGTPGAADEIRLVARRMLALADATPETVADVAAAVSDNHGFRH